MSAIRYIASTVLLASALALGSCEYSQGSKAERKGIATEDTILVAKLEAGLTAAGVPYEVSKAQGRLISVTWEATHNKKASSILSAVDGGTPEGTSSLCFFESNRFDEFTSNLQQNSIPFQSTRPSPGEWCVRWEDEYDDKVAVVDSNWRAIRELEKQTRSSQ